MAVDQVGPAVDEPVRETDLAGRHVIPPVGAPVDGHHDEVTGLLDGLHAGDEAVGSGIGQAWQEINTRPGGGRGPAGRDSAAGGPAGEDDRAAASRYRDGYWLPGLRDVTSGPYGTQPGAGQRVERVGQAGAAKVED